MNEIARCPLPCPFCGKPPEVTHMPVELYNGCIPTRERASWMIRCASLSCCGPSAHSETGEADAIEKWNRRPAAPDDGKGQPVASEIDQSIELAQALGEVGASKVIAQRIVQVLREVEALTEGRTDAFWAGVSMAVDEVAERLQVRSEVEAHPAPQGWQQGAAETLEHVHITDKQAVITGDPADLPESVPEDDPRRHSCDAMGCPTLDHVLYRLPFTDHREMSPHIRNQDEAGGASHE